MGNSLSVDASRRPFSHQGKHECEILGKGLETEESASRWQNCEKNPGHLQFFPVQEFMESYLPPTWNDQQRKLFQSIADLTVRLRVDWTSEDRPALDSLSEHRGSDMPRTGTGYICDVREPGFNKPCPCGECSGESTDFHLQFYVWTALHVVFNSQEAKKTRVDLFYDDENSHLDGRMRTVRAVKVGSLYEFRDMSILMCVTHDQELAERIGSAFRRSQYSLFPSDVCSISSAAKNESLLGSLHKRVRGEEQNDVLIVSHPHGQPKKITVGEMVYFGLEKTHMAYTAATCPGSSGAPVFRISNFVSSSEQNISILPLTDSLHTGAYNRTGPDDPNQINYGAHLYNSTRATFTFK